jgi:hypothetical protein
MVKHLKDGRAKDAAPQQNEEMFDGQPWKRPH